MPSAKGRNVEGEEPPTEAGLPDPSIMSPDPYISPDGMKLRSGKKKRRRSRETSGLTPPEGTEKKKRRLLGTGKYSNSDLPDSDAKLHLDDGTLNVDDEDDSYTDDDGQEMYDGGDSLDDVDDSGESKPPAASAPSTTNGNSGASDAAATLSTMAAGSAADVPHRLQPMPNLRIPSEQTPGRPVLTETIARHAVRVEPSRILHFDAPTSPSLQLPPVLRQQLASQRTSDPNQSIAAGWTAGLKVNNAGGTHFDRETTTLTSDQVQSPTPGLVPGEEVVSGYIPPQAAYWMTSTTTWVIFFFALLLVFNSVLMHPIMTNVTVVSRMLSGGYRSRFPSSKKQLLQSLKNSTILSNSTFINVTEQMVFSSNVTEGSNGPKQNSTSKRNKTKRNKSYKKEMGTSSKPTPKLPPKRVKVMKYVPHEPNADAEQLGRLTEELGVGLAESDIKAISLEIAIAAARKKVNQRKSELIAWSRALSTARVTMEILAEKESRLEPQFVAHGRQNLDYVKEAAGAELDTTILNTTGLGLWNVTIQDCSGVNFSELVDALVSTDELEMTVERLRQSADSAIAAVMQDPNITEKIREWLHGRVSQEMKFNETAIEFLDTLAAEHGVGLSLKSIQAGIQSRLEVERADHNGHVDFASVAKGVVVVRKGMRTTSPSYVDSLPLLNRVMHHSGFRFYGHGPEAALTPTFPPDALGQCWAMENDSKSNCPDPFCGSLGTLTLRFAKPIQVSSLIMEHPPKRPSDSTSSAVQNFRVTGFDDKRAWPFGTFAYDINGRSSQLFTIAPIFPPIREITLAIDSNWGSPYTCIYRFRVHGEVRDA